MIQQLLDYVKNTDNLAFEFVKDKTTPVVLYGKGNALVFYVRFLEKHGIKPFAITDSNVTEESAEYLYGIPVYKIEKVISECPNARIVITSPKYFNEIAKHLSFNLKYDNIFGFETEIFTSFIFDCEEYREFLLANWNRVINLLNSLKDAESVRAIEAFIKGRISANQNYFREVNIPKQYYQKDIFDFSNQEVMVELGSFDGETLREFIEEMNGNFRAAYCFEPDHSCIEKLQKIVDTDSRVHLIRKGAWSEETILHFDVDEGLGTSKVSDGDAHDSNSIPVTTVDHSVNDEVSFIKMDIEGAELQALKGAENTIKKYRPKLAVCIYHNVSDFLDIPEYIHKIVPEYEFYIRHHNYGATETVLYAKIPG